MKHQKLKPAKDREWIQPVMKNYLMGCCDCGLVHRLDFRIIKGYRKKKYVEIVQFRASRSRNYTSRERKKMGITLRTAE